MPKSLSASLVSLIEIGNVGNHTYKSNPRLSKVMLDTLLEFIVWFHSNRDQFSGKLSGYWSDGNEYETRYDEVVGRAECHVDNGKTYWLCNGIRLFVDKRGGIKDGDRVVIRKMQKCTMEPKIDGVEWMAFPKSDKNRDGYVVEDVPGK